MATKTKRANPFGLWDQEDRPLIKFQGGPRTGRERSRPTTLSLSETVRDFLDKMVENGDLHPRQVSTFCELMITRGIQAYGYPIPDTPMHPMGEYALGPRSRMTLTQRRALGLVPEDAVPQKPGRKPKVKNGNGHTAPETE